MTLSNQFKFRFISNLMLGSRAAGREIRPPRRDTRYMSRKRATGRWKQKLNNFSQIRKEAN